MRVRAWLVACVAIVAVGCASSDGGVGRTDSLMASLDNLVKSSATARGDIDALTGSLKKFAEGGGSDPRGLYTQYSAQVGKVAGAKESMSSAADSVRQAMDAHFAAWEQEANQMTNPDIRAASMKRRDEARSKMSAVEPARTKASAAFDAYVANLRDIEKLLGSDLSAGGIKAAEDLVDKAIDESGQVKEGLEKVEATAGEIMKGLSVQASPPPEGTPPAKEGEAPAK